MIASVFFVVVIYVALLSIGTYTLLESWKLENRHMGLAWRAVGTCLFLLTVVGPLLAVASIKGWLP